MPTNSDTLEPADLLLIGLPFMNDAWAKYPNDREHMKQAFKASEGYKQALTALTEREDRQALKTRNKWAVNSLKQLYIWIDLHKIDDIEMIKEYIEGVEISLTQFPDQRMVDYSELTKESKEL